MVFIVQKKRDKALEDAVLSCDQVQQVVICLLVLFDYYRSKDLPSWSLILITLLKSSWVSWRSFLSCAIKETASLLLKCTIDRDRCFVAVYPIEEQQVDWMYRGIYREVRCLLWWPEVWNIVCRYFANFAEYFHVTMNPLSMTIEMIVIWLKSWLQQMHFVAAKVQLIIKESIVNTITNW